MKNDLVLNHRRIDEILKRMPKRKLSELEKQTVFVLLEKSKLVRQRSFSAMNQTLVFLGLFIVLASTKLVEVITPLIMNIMFVSSVIVLLVISLIYHKNVENEEEMLDSILDSLLS